MPCADCFVAGPEEQRQLLARPLYVALTRARSVLYVSATLRGADGPPAAIVQALQTALEDQQSAPAIAAACTPGEELSELLERVGAEHRDWLRRLARRAPLMAGPIVAADGAIVAEPLFRFEHDGRRTACFASAPTPLVANELSDLGVAVLLPGQDPGA